MFFPGRRCKRSNVVRLRKTNRVGYLIPWQANPAVRPWKEGYSRVFIPFTRDEMRSRRLPGHNAACPAKLGHIQVLRNSSLDFNVAT
jgi:hypothetical protein